MRSWISGAVAAIVLVAAPVCAAALQSLSVVSEKGTFPYKVELANDDASREKGLMFRKQMPKDHGMLFVFAKNQVAYMWMKNTFIPLDMVFIDARGRIAAIFERTVPHSLKTVAHPRPVKAVLELRGGEAARRGLKVGDRVDHPAFRGRD